MQQGALGLKWLSFLMVCLVITGMFSVSAYSTSFPQQLSTFQQGQVDRQAWETWFGALAGDYRAGALYWAGQRSLPSPGPCNVTVSPTNRDWTAGCFAAQMWLAHSDMRRKTEPDYRQGWNNLPPAAAPPLPYNADAAPTTQTQQSGASGVINAPNNVPARPSERAVPHWEKISSDKSMVTYIDKLDIGRRGRIATIWLLQDLGAYLDPDGKEVPVGPPGKEFKSIKFQIEYDCKSNLYKTLYYGTFSEHMGRGMLADGGPVENGDLFADWKSVPSDLEKGRQIACEPTGQGNTPAGAGTSQFGDAPLDFLTQWNDARQSHCNLRHTPMQCSQYMEDLHGCMSAATKASTILQIVRLFISRGEAPSVAARFAAGQVGRDDIAVLATTAPPEMTPREFSNRVMKACLSEIDR